MSAIVRVLPSGRQFVVEANEPLLDAALRSGLALEFGCTNGTCGECRARVREGRVRRIRFHDYVIPEAEKREGAVLLCSCTADGDVTIEAGEAGGPEDIPVQKLRARLYRQEHAGDGVEIVQLRVMRGKMLRFLAGQHVRLKLVDSTPVDVSIASCPCDGLNLEFHLDTRDANALSARALGGFSKSDRFEIDGPRGRFILDEGSARPLVFIACDTAVAPVKSIIEHVINLELPQPVYLCWYATRPGAHYLHNYFRSLADALDAFDYRPVVGTVSEEMIKYLPDLGSADVYLSGSEAFVKRAGELLRAGGVTANRLFIDALNRRPSSPPAD